MFNLKCECCRETLELNTGYFDYNNSWNHFEISILEGNTIKIKCKLCNQENKLIVKTQKFECCKACGVLDTDICNNCIMIDNNIGNKFVYKI